MAIDKMIPRFLVSDEDERLLKEGAMTDALNVTISEDGDGSEGVVKNVKGTIAATAFNSGFNLAVGDAVTVIGQVSDPQRGFLYFFVADDVGSSEDAIYQYSVSSNEYKAVIKSSFLGFNKTSFIKADILNLSTNSGSDVETLIYFTDNQNPPRKINVDRALLGDYSGLNSSKFKDAISSIKAANNKFPLVTLETDYNILQNNLSEDTFQFSTQNIFRDGEESALSPYSALAVSKVLFLNSMENSGFSSNPFLENVCVVDLQVNKTLNDLSEVRLIARKGNSGSFFVVDEFDPNKDLYREIAGSSVKVYSQSTGRYKFYNSILGSSVPIGTVNKLYDNVPFIAEGQAISGNRLFYSNYTEGRDNISTNVDIDVQYSSLESKDENFISSTIPPLFIVQAGGNSLDVSIDLLAGNSFDTLETGSADENTLIPAGTVIQIGFDWAGQNCNLNILSSITGGGVFRLTGNGINGSDITAGIQVKSPDLVSLSYHDGVNTNQPQGIQFNYIVPQDRKISDVASDLEDQLIGKTLECVYDIDVDLLPISGSAGMPEGSTGVNMDGKVTVTWDFSDSTSFTGGFTIKPKITNVSILSGSGAYPYSEGAHPELTGSNIANNAAFNTSEDQDSNILGSFSLTGALTLNGTGTGAYLSNNTASAKTIQAKPTFKSGSTHSFGIVYFDRFNRSGFVNELGSCYVKTINERKNSTPVINELGPASIKITFNHNPPDWADRYQIVYAGSDSIDSYVQYTTGPAFVATTNITGGNTNDPHYTDVENKRIYVSLNNLEDYRLEKNATRNYSFTKGDKLRVIKYKSDDNSSDVYPVATTDGSVVEFEVVGVEVFSHDSSAQTTPVQIVRESNHDAQASSTDEEVHEGTFLVLEASRINGGEAGVRYLGLDWGEVSAYDLIDESTYTSNITGSNNVNHWGKQTLVEIYTPKKTTSDKVYYEIGHGDRCGTRKGVSVNEHGASITLTNGDAWLRPVPCKTALHATDLDSDINTALNSNTPWTAWEARKRYDTFGYKTLFLETDNLSDRFESSSWSKGRSHVPFKKSKTIRRFNGVTYSDAYAEDVANLSLSSFNPSLSNFDSLESKFGSINYIGNYNNNLVAIQENKLSLVPVGKNIIQYAEGSGNVAISTNVLGQARYSSGDYGCGGHPEAVLIQDNDVFFVDESRQAVMRLGGEQLAPISEKNMSSFFEDFFKAGHAKYVSGYDPRISTYFITGYGGSGAAYSAETIGYDVARGVWQSKYSFTPDVYANQNNMLYSAKYTSGNDIFWRHDDDVTPNRNTFYGTAYPSEVEMVSKISPSRVKVYNALSYEGDSAEWDMSPVSTDLDQTSGTITSWSEREGSYYASMPRDTSSSSTSQKMYVGTLSVGALSPNTVLTSTIRLNRLNIPIGVGLYLEDNTLITVLSVSGNSMTVSGIVPQADGQDHIILSDSNGDPIRGHYAKIKLTNSSNSKHELYCINTHITDSKSHHPLGQ